MLAGFYASAVMLRFEYPMMILTKTKDVFLKRLTRNKKILTEEGSSDQSKTNSLSHSVQLHTNTFLESVNSSELSKKTAELRDQLFPEFREKPKKDKSWDSSVHDILNPPPSFDDSLVKKRESLLEEPFEDKLLKLSKNISLNEMINYEAVQVNLSPNQADISYLVCDFEEFDKEETIKNYEKLKSREKQNLNYFQNHQDDQHSSERFKKKSKMFVTPFEQNPGYSNHQKTLQNPKSRRLPKQMQFSAIQRELKTRPVYPHDNRVPSKMSAFYQTKNSLMMMDGQENQHEESYKTLERFRTSNGQKSNEHELKHIYNDRNMYGASRAKASSYHENNLPRTRSNNVFNIRRQPEQFNDYDQIVEKPKLYKAYDQQETDSFRRREKYLQTGNQYNQRYGNIRHQEINERYSNKNRQNRMEERYVTEFDLNEQNQRVNSPRFAHVNDHESEQEKFSICSKHSSKMQRQQNPPYFALHTEKYCPSGYQDQAINNKFRHSEDTYSIAYHQEVPPSMVQRQNFDQKLEKKKKIREKAAQLLSRVKSQEYLTARHDLPYSKRY